MRSSRVRLTLRRRMIALVAVAMVLAVERFLYHSAARAVGSGADGDYIWREAVTVWLFFNIALLFAALIVFRIFLAFIRLMILGLALKRLRVANSHAMRLTESTWSPFQSAEVRDICEHLTFEEKVQLASHGSRSGRNIGILFSLPLVYAWEGEDDRRTIIQGVFALDPERMTWTKIADRRRSR
jgi:hypothetical protein